MDLSDREPAIELQDLRFGWDSEMVLEIDHFSVGRGERLFLGGPSGSGKSSMLSLLSGVASPQHGSVKVLGTDLSKTQGAARDHFRANHIGYIFQLFNLVPYLSVIENVTLALRFSKARAAKVQQPEQEAIRLLEHLGLGGMVKRRVLDLSVGQQQRVAAARALIGSPEIILADEPTSALDPEHSQRFIELLFQECAAQQLTLVFVSHDRQLAEHFDRSYLLEGAQA